ncbi:tRNAHis guanylyltransferase-domain-containing protein [Blyttiomyces helicus]|uniref:tRNA(His) guanylyltransferase n=1 Tax=Blyttiomyces helicus TaxID=388810 RepID=A0A4P9VUP7_9FUNG|nr:tRNAHis guanylyltransferase-domain-containing protein [Blyttiomyces helicus]|eukprot:RKO83321.1 tRNAHis guanylyltransferase-domain-containing protein [Blyttiomyces helicus]
MSTPPCQGAEIAAMPDSARKAMEVARESSLGDRMKSLEHSAEISVPPSQPFVVRLDGCSFSRFTSGLRRPWDPRLTDAMVRTTMDLVEKFGPTTGYTQSDEITLVFRAGDAEQTNSPHATFSHIYSGRVQKLSSVIASYASVRFNHHLRRADFRDLPPAVGARMRDSVAHFDGRTVPVPDPGAATDCVFWRAQVDCLRNVVSTIAQTHYSHSALQKIGTHKMVRMLQADHGVDVFRDIEARFLWGTWVKRETFAIEGMLHPKTGEPIPGPVVRKRIRTGSFNWADWEEDARVAFTMAKYWPEGPNEPPRDPLGKLER